MMLCGEFFFCHLDGNFIIAEFALFEEILHYFHCHCESHSFSSFYPTDTVETFFSFLELDEQKVFIIAFDCRSQFSVEIISIRMLVGRFKVISGESSQVIASLLDYSKCRDNFTFTS